jgi:3-hydroxyisobutyrate dehydrogenase
MIWPMMSTDETRVGVIGLGRMGLPICRRLMRTGFAVAGHDTDDAAQASLAALGGQGIASRAELAARSEVILTVLPGPEELGAMLEPLLTEMRPGATWIDMSTATPALGRERARAGSERGVHVVEAPMGGGPEQARDGQLLIYAGGDAADLSRQRTLLDALAAHVLHVGSFGAGYTVKLLVNLLWFGQAVANSEALVLAVRAGVDPETFRRTVQMSAAASRFMDSDATALMAGDNKAAFSLARSRDELTAVTEMAAELDVPLLLGDRVAEVYGQALERYGDVLGELLGARLAADRAGVDFDAPAPS